MTFTIKKACSSFTAAVLLCFPSFSISFAQVILNTDSPYWGDNSTTNTTDNTYDNSTTNSTSDNEITFSSNMPGDNLEAVVNDWDGAVGGVTSKPSDIKCGVVDGKDDYNCSANFQNGRKISMWVKAANLNSKIGVINLSYPDSSPLEPPPLITCNRIGDNDMSCSVIASADVATFTVNFLKKSAAKLVLLDATLNQKSIKVGGAFPGITMTLKNDGTQSSISGCLFDGPADASCSNYYIQLKIVYMKNGQKQTDTWRLSEDTPMVAPGQTSVIDVTNLAPVLNQAGSYAVEVIVDNENGEQTEKDLRFEVKN